MPLQQLTRKKLLFNNTTYLRGKNSHNMESCCNHRSTHCSYQDILHDSCTNCSHRQHRIHFSQTLPHQPAYLSPELHHLRPDKKRSKKKTYGAVSHFEVISRLLWSCTRVTSQSSRRFTLLQRCNFHLHNSYPNNWATIEWATKLPHFQWHCEF